MPPSDSPRLMRAWPPCVCPGGTITLTGRNLLPDGDLPAVALGDTPVRLLAASPRELSFRVPATAPGGTLPICVGSMSGDPLDVEVARILTAGVHQVDSPAFDRL